MSGVFGAIKQIYSHSGFLGLFKGHTVTLTRIFPYAAINFAAFEKFKVILRPEQDSNGSSLRKLLAGSLAGTLAVSCTYPLDIIRARIAYDLHQGNNQCISNKVTFKTVTLQLSKESKQSRTRFPFKGF